MIESNTPTASVTEQGVKMKMIRRFLASESGATAIEYGLVAALISVAIIGGATALGTGVNNTLTNVSNEL